ncbi:tripartite tricarboxylate transporter substrate binding protein [Variovorax sp. J22P271]|uniref:Bug family tripartite tricarboxylate transporter substrate binding protein n=1 Tax=Variovorax davisae TaxID=3053515 RepID=UPI0025787CA6|nr:tripartite tricarboxylate transporter substrate binding protein [Variovorax sp. J22P271]MDM0032017.1 tripartite tricarboxylate transporter substrate binding protein [Variovorax sp. J22P271]
MPRSRSCRALSLTALLLTSLAFSHPAAAQAFPTKKPIRLIVPFAAGGGTDVISRVLGAGIGAELHQTVIVENKPGAGTLIGSDYVAKSAPDGYTLLMATFAHAVNPSLLTKLPYNQATAFAPLSLVGESPNVLVVRPEHAVKSVADLVAYAKANPGKLSYGSFGNGTSAHLAGELFKSLAKVDLTHVPYRGSAPALTDLLGGQIDMMFTTTASVAPYIASGKLRALAVTSPQRSSALPNVPTVAESGVPGYVAQSWYGLYAPAGTPRDVVMQLNAAIRKAASSETFRKRIEDEGLVVRASPPEELARYVAAEEARWGKVVRDAHITID